MPPGGARARSGPVPEQNALRRDRPSDRAGWTVLPAAGREGAAPTWPLPTPADAGARRIWRALWVRPEAVMWEAAGQQIQVALYVLAVIAAEGSKATAADRRAALSFMDDLGLSNGGRARNRWVIADDTRREDPTAGAPRPTGSRSQLLELVVDNDSGA